MRFLAILDRKILRRLWQLRGQVVAIALVIACGVAVFVMMRGAVHTLDLTRNAYYERYRFADLFVPMTRAPNYLADQAALLDGVATAESRIHGSLLVDLPDGGLPGLSGTVLSVPVHSRPALNDLYLTSGRWPDPDRTDDAILLQGFALAHNLRPGDYLSVTMKGKRRDLHIVGLALSPEFVYPIPPGELVPDNSRFAVVWMGRKALENAYGLEGAFNELVVDLSWHANEDSVVTALDNLFADYGGQKTIRRKDQISNRFLSNEIDQLKLLSRIVPLIFLAVASFLLNVAIMRMVQAERVQIGLLKAVGYSNLNLLLHYLKTALGIVALGVFIGWFAGTWMGRGLAEMYADFFTFPLLIFKPGLFPYVTSALVSSLAGILGVLAALIRVVRLRPAEAMHPAPPTDYQRMNGSLTGMLSRGVDQPTRMILRHLGRWPLRAAIACLGIGLAMGIRVASQSSWDSIDHVMAVTYGHLTRQDLTVTFVDPQGSRILYELRTIPGVVAAEPYRVASTRIAHGAIERQEGIIGVMEYSDLSRLMNGREEIVQPPPDGIVLSDALANDLNAKPGDLLTVSITEGKRVTATLPVTSVSTAYFGAPAFMELSALDRLMEEGPRVSGAYLAVDRGRRDEIVDKLADMPTVATVTIQQAARNSLQEQMDEFLGTMTFFNTVFASLIAIGVVYNSIRVTLAERGREIASLRVLGFTKGEVSYILLGEVALLAFAALPLGAAIGYGLAWFIMTSLSSDLFTMPTVISVVTYGIGALTITIAVILSGAWAIRAIGTLDLIAVLKTRE